MRLGYNTNGFAHHRLDDALEILAELGYDAVALTPDVHHLPPFETTPAGLRELRRRLATLGIAAVIETGARYVLDPRRKHRPTLLEEDPGERRRRFDFLVRCAEIAAELEAGVVSIWSGALPPGADAGAAWRRLVDGVGAFCDRAAALGVRVGFEPEPGMLVASLAEWDRLRDAVAHPALGLTLDVGHVPCTEDATPAAVLVARAGELVNVHLDDVRGRVHEHLQVGDGELDWSAIARTLREIGYRGIAAFELSRHSHAAPEAAAEALRRFRAHSAHAMRP